MRLLKGFILAITGLFIVVTLFSLLIPSRVITMRTAVIHARHAQVFAEIADLQNWKHWHPVFMQDSAAMHFSEPSSGANAYAEWTAKGRTNRLMVTEALPDQLKASLLREGENDVINIISISTLKDSNNVQVEWRVFTKLKWYPWEKFSGIFIDKMTGPGYESALNNLKEIIEGRSSN
ncbi:MAG: hypothetical protein ABI741_04845 [Ferruginibacter sp.]